MNSKEMQLEGLRMQVIGNAKKAIGEAKQIVKSSALPRSTQ
jgi:uncharacterized protein YjbJ (UPF0337 family)